MGSAHGNCHVFRISPGGKVEHVGRSKPEINNIHSAIDQRINKCPMKRWRAHAHVAANLNGRRIEAINYCLSNTADAFFIQLIGNNSPDVIIPEDGRINHHNEHILDFTDHQVKQ